MMYRALEWAEVVCDRVAGYGLAGYTGRRWPGRAFWFRLMVRAMWLRSWLIDKRLP